MCFCVCVFQNGQNSRLVNIPKWPKGSEMINQMFLFSRPFWARVDPFWIISNNKRLFCSKASLPNLVGPQIDFCLKWSKRVPNCQKHLGLSFWTLLDPFGLLWNVDKPDMFGHFCLFYWCVFFGTPRSLVLLANLVMIFQWNMVISSTYILPNIRRSKHYIVLLVGPQGGS